MNAQLIKVKKPEGRKKCLPKTVDSEAVLKTIATNLSTLWVTGITRSDSPVLFVSITISAIKSIQNSGDVPIV